jgi:hypothetical protein
LTGLTSIEVVSSSQGGPACPPTAHAGPLVQSLRLTGQLKFRSARVLATWLRAVAHTEILEGELALSIAQWTNRNSGTSMIVVSWCGFNANDAILGFAIRAMCKLLCLSLLVWPVTCVLGTRTTQNRMFFKSARELGPASLIQAGHTRALSSGPPGCQLSHAVQIEKVSAERGRRAAPQASASRLRKRPSERSQFLTVSSPSRLATYDQTASASPTQANTVHR